MIDIKEEIQIILLKKKLSLRKLVGQMNKEGHQLGSVQNLSNKLSKKTIRFEEVQEILDFLGCEINITY